jgi:hypothetical protein
MKYFNLLLLALLLSCNSVITDKITLKGVEDGDSDHLSEGVYLKIPPGYKPAKSYEGFQAPNAESSFSLKTVSQTMQEYMAVYNSDKFPSHYEILEKRPVSFNGSDSGYYLVIENSKKKTTKHTLVLEKDQVLYKITGFYFTPLADKYKSKIRRALYSTYFGENIAKEERFKIANLKDFSAVVYTQDGEYPTKTEDNLHMEVESIDNIQDIYPETFIKRRLNKVIDVKNPKMITELLENGKLITIKASSSDKKVLIALIVNEDQNKGKLVTFSGNQTIDLNELEAYLRTQIISYTI